MASACVKTIGVQPENFIDCPPATFPAFGWLNPRISFSREYSDEKKPSVTLEASDPAKDAADFEFRLDDSVTMLPADELFSDGKLMPLQLTATRSAPSTSTDPPVSSETTKSLRASEALFSPKAPRCSSRWREILGLKKLYQNNNNNKTNSSSNVATPSNSSSNTGKSIRQFLLRNTKSLPESNTDASLNLPLLKESKDSDSESISVSSSRLSLSSSSSGHDFDDLPRISLDSDSKNNNIQPHTSLSRCSSGSNHVPGHPRVRMVKPRMAPASVAENPKPLIDHPSAPTPITRTISVDSPRMSSSGKIVFQGLERSSSSPSSFNGGPKYNKNRGMERSYSANVRVTPVLNVPVCSLRGSSKSGVFGLFSQSQKKEGGNSKAQHHNRNGNRVKRGSE